MKTVNLLYIDGSKEELKKVEDGLIDLGYINSGNLGDTKIAVGDNRTFWYTNASKIGAVGSDGLSVNARHLDFILAAAAMTEGKDWIVGEWLMCNKEYFGITKQPFKVKDLGGCNYIYGSAGNKYKKYYKKATLNELLNHFELLMTEDQVVSSWYEKQIQESEKIFNDGLIHQCLAGSPTKEIVGYRFKKRYEKYRKQAEELAQYIKSDFPIEYYLKPYNIMTRMLQEAGVLDLWFEPVYKGDEKQTVPINTYAGLKEVEVSKKGIYYPEDGMWINVDDLRIFTSKQGIRKSPKSDTWQTGQHYESQAERVTIGCLKDVCVKDIRTIISIYDKL